MVGGGNGSLAVINNTGKQSLRNGNRWLTGTATINDPRTVSSGSKAILLATRGILRYTEQPYYFLNLLTHFSGLIQ
jgi:hypothetical protein